ncbi:MAG: cysteine desulfurase NifS [Anaerovoracaceae bacterium]|jgi:cysteine desulfurase
MRQVYLDYAATTPVKKEVLEEMLPFHMECYGNPSSLHEMGIQAKQAIDLARKRIAQLINSDPAEIYFTSGGTEADNWALLATSLSKKKEGNHIITTKVEHHAILHTAKFLENAGFQITYVDVDRKGRVLIDQLEKSITDKTILISVMMANNEVGTIQPIKQIAELAKRHGILFHTDGVQAVGNMIVDVEDLGVDMLSLSSHKIYGPKGVGALYIRRGVPIGNFIHGGAQENKLRAGTENVAGIVGFGKAAQMAVERLEDYTERLRTLRDYFLKEITAKIEDVEINGDMDRRLPGNANVIFHYIEGEAILLYLDAKGIFASTGSACSSATFAPSHVLAAMGVPIEHAYSSLRFTFGDGTTKEEIDYVVEEIATAVTKLRAFSPFNKERNMNTMMKDKNMAD